eukprot:3848835-Amphidinium_carterae.1
MVTPSCACDIATASHTYGTPPSLTVREIMEGIVVQMFLLWGPVFVLTSDVFGMARGMNTVHRQSHKTPWRPS